MPDIESDAARNVPTRTTDEKYTEAVLPDSNKVLFNTLIRFVCLLWLQYHPKVSFAIHLHNQWLIKTDVTEEAGLFHGRHSIEEGLVIDSIA